MKVVFDPDIAVIGVGLSPWVRLGPERWLKKYVIAALYDWDVHDVPGAPELLSLMHEQPRVPPPPLLTTEALLATPALQALLAKKLGYDLLLYKSISAPGLLKGRRLLVSDYVLARSIENKAEFRRLFGNEIPFPNYRIVERSHITPDATGLKLLLGGKPRAIVQDDQISGGRGTFVIRDLTSLGTALDRIQQLGGGKRLVVSEFIEGGHERSVQCCVTRYGVLVGPLQKQLVNDPALANMQVNTSDKFCGGEIGGDDRFAGAYSQIRTIALTVGERLAELGYKGIFGVDYLVNNQGKVFVLEVNPRLTGMTPLITKLYRDERDIPFYLLHILELGGYEYRLADWDLAAPATGGMLLQHVVSPTGLRATGSLPSGIFTSSDLAFKRKAINFEKGGHEQLLVQNYSALRGKINTGERLLTAFFNRAIFDTYDKPNANAAKIMRDLTERAGLPNRPDPET